MEVLHQIAKTLKDEEKWLVELKEEFPQANVYLVGGIVRDAYLGRKSKDVDIVVENVHKNSLQAFLIDHTDLKLDEVGVSFSILKVTSKIRTYDVAVTRKDTKVSEGHRGFEIDDENISIIDDLTRRDFTVNAIAYNIFTGEIVDPHEGLHHLESMQLVPTYANSFIEDPLRILRGLQFIARFGFTISKSTYTLLFAALPLLVDISDERIFIEIRKLKTSKQRGIFINMWRQLRINTYLWPEFEDGDMDIIPQYIESASECIYHLINCATSSETESFLKKSAITTRERKEISILQKLDYQRPLTVQALLDIVDQFPEIRFNGNYRYLQLQDIPITRELLINGDDLVKIGFKPGKIFKEVFDRLRIELMSWSMDSMLRNNRKEQLDLIKTLYQKE